MLSRTYGWHIPYNSTTTSAREDIRDDVNMRGSVVPTTFIWLPDVAETQYKRGFGRKGET